MRKKQSSLFILVLIIGLYGKENIYAQESELKVVGVSKVSVEPTITEIRFAISTLNISYPEAVKQLTERVDVLTSELEDSDFEKEEILTANFNINSNTIFRNGQRLDSGFIASQELVVQFEMSNERLLEVLNKTTNSKAFPELSIKFTLDRDSKEKLQRELIKLAVMDAREKAQLIAETSDYILTEIKEIDYGYVPNLREDIFPIVESVLYENLELRDFTITNFQQQDLTFTDKVFVIYLIERE